MSRRGASCLYFIPPNTTLNRSKYVELPKEKLKLYIHVHGCTIFIQDGAKLKGSHLLPENRPLGKNSPETAHISI